MNLLFDLNHPAHFHLFKNTLNELKRRGHQIWITARKKDVLLDLLNINKLEYILLDKSRNKIKDHFHNIKKLRNVFKKESIDLAIGVSALIAQASLFANTKSLVLDDDDFKATPFFALASHTFANHILVPAILKKTTKKYINHQSLHELAYLHPNQFQANKSVLNQYKLENKAYYILRLSALKAHHDIGEEGINYQQSIQILDILKAKGSILISSENPLPKNLEQYSIKSPDHFHHLLAFSKLLVCDSQTVASEAAVLGVPSVRINSFVGRISYLEELEHKYQLTFGFKPSQFDIAKQKIQELLDENQIEVFTNRRQKLLSEKIDLTAFLVWFIESYPDSVKILKENPDYHYNFK